MNEMSKATAVEKSCEDGRLLLRAGRVTLREHTPDDAAALADGQPAGLVWIDWVPGPETAWAAGMTARAAAVGLHRRPWGIFAILRSQDRMALGSIGFHGPPDENGLVEIGYDLSPSARGDGWATDAARLLTGWALAEPQVRTVLATTKPGNLPSQRVLERAGFTRVADRDLLWAFEVTDPAALSAAGPLAQAVENGCRGSRPVRHHPRP